jgi:erythromycin esterase-like protein
MGADLVAWHRPELYTVGLYMHAGSAAWNDKTVYTISPASMNSLEDILNGGGAEIFFVDLLHQQKSSANAWMFEFTGARTWGTGVLSMVPRDQYDALIQVRTVHPPDYIFF